MTLPAVPVSKTIQYTLKITDVNGEPDRQVLLGGAGQQRHRGPARHPHAAEPDQQVKPITAQTIFVRQDTLQATATAGAYHWAPGVPVSGTVTNRPTDLLSSTRPAWAR